MKDIRFILGVVGMASILAACNSDPNQTPAANSATDSGNLKAQAINKLIKASGPTAWDNLAQGGTAIAGGKYTASFRVKGAGTVSLRFFEVLNNSWSTRLAILPCEASSVWKTCSIPITMGTNPNFAFNITNDGPASAPTLIDDAQLLDSSGKNILLNGNFEAATIEPWWSGPAFTLVSEDDGAGGPSGDPPVTGGAAQRWSDPNTWPNQVVPAIGSSVTIPADKTVLLDQNVALDGLNVMGTLRFEDKDLELKSAYVMVHGRLEVGTSSVPFAKRATITLTGAASSNDVMGMGTKFLGTMGSGVIEMFGENRTSWTKLSATAAKGASSIQLETAPAWRVGDELVLASSGYRTYGVDQTERRKITAINGNTVALDGNLQYRHWGQTQTIAGLPLDERAEIGLLSKNITVQGEATGDFGGHVMIMPGGALRANGVHFANLGQAGKLGRYPIHWHTVGNGSGQYVKNSSITDSNNRCIVVHATDNLKLENNVCDNLKGHGIFLEEASETGNSITGNLVVRAEKPADGQRILPSEIEPAAYWITNPDNDVSNNVAASSSGKGFWLAFPNKPFGTSSNEPDRPVNTILKRFENNVAHSNAVYGLYADSPAANNDPGFVANRHDPRINPQDPNSAIAPTVIKNFVAYKQMDLGVWYTANRIKLENLTLADNAAGLQGANDSWFTDPDERKAGINGGLVVGASENDEPEIKLPWFFGVSLYDGRVIVKNVSFANFLTARHPRAAAINVAEDDQLALLNRPQILAAKYVNTVGFRLEEPDTNTEHIGEDFTQVHYDADGSWSGSAPGRFIVGKYPYVLTPNCINRLADLNGYICNENYFQSSLFFGAQPLDFKTNPKQRITRDDGAVFEHSDDNTALISGRKYTWTWQNANPSSIRLEFGEMKPGYWAGITIPWAGATLKTKGNISGWGEMTASSSVAEVDAGTGDRFYWNQSAKTIYFKAAYNATVGETHAYYFEPR
jgi:cell surface hyaluronidase